MEDLLKKHQQELGLLIRESGISYLAVFGSQSRGDAKANSDIDLLVDFNRPVGLFHIAGIQLKLQRMFDRNVDLVTRDGLNKLINPFIQDDLKVIYEENA